MNSLLDGGQALVLAAYGAGLVYVVCIVVGLNVPVPSGWNAVVGKGSDVALKRRRLWNMIKIGARRRPRRRWCLGWRREPVRVPEEGVYINSLLGGGQALVLAAYGAGLLRVVCIVVGLNVPVPSGWNVVIGGRQRRRFRATSAVGSD